MIKVNCHLFNGRNIVHCVRVWLWLIISVFSFFTFCTAIEAENWKEIEEEDIRFLLYSNQKNISDYEELKIEQPSTISSSKYLRGRPLKLLIHGFSSDCKKKTFPQLVIQAYLNNNEERKRKYNIVCVDWAPLGHYDGLVKFAAAYIYAKNINTIPIGEKITTLLILLKEKGMIKRYSDVHILGHSLGSHVAGIAGYLVQQYTGKKVGRISGLDSAGPLYRLEQGRLDEKLDPEDAQFVDVIHTNGGKSGLEHTHGHADFYINGGERQPRCLSQDRTIYETLSEVFVGGCSHNIVAEYWAKTIRNPTVRNACLARSYTNFILKSNLGQCFGEEMVAFGEKCPPSTRGTFYLNL